MVERQELGRTGPCAGGQELGRADERRPGPCAGGSWRMSGSWGGRACRWVGGFFFLAAVVASDGWGLRGVLRQPVASAWPWEALCMPVCRLISVV